MVRVVTEKQIGTATVSDSPIGEHWRITLLTEEATLRDAILNLNKSGLQIVIVVSNDDVLVGTLTDGDIRRGLLRGLDMESPVESIVYRDPLVAPPRLDRDAVFQLMHANQIHQLPVVESNGRVVGLHLLDELVKPGTRENLMVIMAGGEGRRLRPHTEHCPKPLLPVNGKPMLEQIIERAKMGGIQEFAIAINYLGHMIEDYFGDGSKMQVQIKYLHEETPLGTAGAIGLLDPRPSKPVLVCNGDVLTDIRCGDLLDYHIKHGAAATMAVRVHEWQHPFGVVKTEGVEIVGFEEKPITRSHINAGIYVLAPSAIEALRSGEHCDMPSLFETLIKRGEKAIVYPTHERWLDMGRPVDYEHAKQQLIELDQFHWPVASRD